MVEKKDKIILVSSDGDIEWVEKKHKYYEEGIPMPRTNASEKVKESFERKNFIDNLLDRIREIDTFLDFALNTLESDDEDKNKKIKYFINKAKRESRKIYCLLPEGKIKKEDLYCFNIPCNS